MYKYICMYIYIRIHKYAYFIYKLLLEKKGKEKIAFEDFIRVSTFITEDIIVYVSCVLLHYK